MQGALSEPLLGGRENDYQKREWAKLVRHLFKLLTPVTCLTAASISTLRQSESYQFSSLGPVFRHHDNNIPTGTLSARTLLNNQSLIESFSTTVVFTQLASLHLLLNRIIDPKVTRLSNKRRLALSCFMGAILYGASGLSLSSMSLTIDYLFPIGLSLGLAVGLVNELLIKKATAPLYQFDHQQYLVPLLFMSFALYLMWHISQTDTSYSTATQANISPTGFIVQNQRFLPFITQQASTFSWITTGILSALFALSCRSSTALINTAFRMLRSWAGMTTSVTMMHISANHYHTDQYNCSIINPTYNQNHTSLYADLDCPPNIRSSAFLNASLGSILMMGGLYFAYRLRQHYITRRVYQGILGAVPSLTVKMMTACLVLIPNHDIPRPLSYFLLALTGIACLISMLRYYPSTMKGYERYLSHSHYRKRIQIMNALYTGALYGGFTGLAWIGGYAGTTSMTLLSSIVFGMSQHIANQNAFAVASDRIFHTMQFLIPLMRFSDFVLFDEPPVNAITPINSPLGIYSTFLIPLSPLIAFIMDRVQLNRESRFTPFAYENNDMVFKARDAHVISAMLAASITILSTLGAENEHRNGNIEYRLNGPFRDFVYASVDSPHQYAKRFLTASASFSSLYLVANVLYRYAKYRETQASENQQITGRRAITAFHRLPTSYSALNLAGPGGR